jgi:CheY-like chemotaxis protein
MNQDTQPLVILMADDDEDDQKLAQDAMQRVCTDVTLHFVDDGVELMDYLRHRGRYEQNDGTRPRLILLDLNMPMKDGREALAEIKSDDDLRQIPVIVLTTSEASEDVRMTYELGANAFISKPTSFSELIRLMSTICTYWLHVVRLPKESA